MDISVRYAKEQDYEDVERIMKQVQHMHVEWRPDIYRDADVVLPLAMFRERLQEKQVVVAECDGRVQGLLIYETRSIAGGPLVERKVLFVDSMAVDESCRGQGIGHRMFDFAKQIYREGRYDGFELQVNARNKAARAMYEKYGFAEKSVNMELV
ncbi:MAG: GNAT family N-acetyltransferase [Acetatifactor sp.]